MRIGITYGKSSHSQVGAFENAVEVLSTDSVHFMEVVDIRDFLTGGAKYAGTSHGLKIRLGWRSLGWRVFGVRRWV